MIKNVICPDGQRWPAEKCRIGACRLPNRCRPLTFLQLALDDRPWTGVPSTTQLLNGARLNYLRIVKDYDVDPRSRVYAVQGTKSHAALEKYDNSYSFTEERLADDISSGGFDNLEQEPDGSWTLWDYKFVGSFNIMKALGIRKVPVPVLADNGSPIYYKTGKKAGQQKTKLEVQINPENADMRDWELQLNDYRIKIEKQLKIKVARLKIHAVVRDGGTKAAFSRGIMDREYSFDIRIVGEQQVREFYEPRAKALIQALDSGIMPPPCNARESWDGRRCESYEFCPVRNYCIQNGDNPYANSVTEEEDDDE